MRFTVTWHPLAEQELADIWFRSSDRAADAQAANYVDHVLATDPLAQGVEFYGDRLLVIFAPGSNLYGQRSGPKRPDFASLAAVAKVQQLTSTAKPQPHQ